MTPAMQVGDVRVGAIVTNSYGTGPNEVMAIRASDEGVPASRAATSATTSGRGTIGSSG